MDDYLCYIVNKFFNLLGFIVVSIFQIKLYDVVIGFIIGVRVLNFIFFRIIKKTNMLYDQNM